MNVASRLLKPWLERQLSSGTPSIGSQTQAVCAFLEDDREAGEVDETQIIAGLSAAGILIDLGIDDTSIAAAILFQCQPSLSVDPERLHGRFDEGLTALLDGLNRIASVRPLRIDHGEQSHLQSEQLRKMLLAMTADLRVVLIRLADRVVAMRALTRASVEMQRRTAKEVIDIYAPLANRLGIWQLKWELEDMSLRFLEPVLYQRIAKLLDERRQDREAFISEVVKMVQDDCSRAGVARAVVTGRPKHIYSIWRKMERKHLNFQDIYDVRGIRVLVDDVQSCYSVLGMVHSRWKYIPGEFDDYIATPKDNGYQSIHTAVIGPQGKVVEIQIRTFAMHEHNELGVAAHWRYKEGKGEDTAFDHKVAWLRQLLDWRHVAAEEGDIVDRFKTAVFQDRIYVFSPKGRVVDLPKGATAVDFAYRIHTDIGHGCRGAKVDGRMVPLAYTLQSGQCIEIIKSRNPGPSRDWLNAQLGYLKTARARSKVQQWFRHVDREKNVAAGRQILERELKRMGLLEIRRETLSDRMGYRELDDFLLAIANNDVKVTRFISVAQDLARPHEDAVGEDIPLSRPSIDERSGKGIRVLGVGDLLTNLAQCCKPVPGDSISGYITVGRGISVHRTDCRNLERCIEKHPTRVVDLEWGDDAGTSYPVDIRIKAFDRKGLLSDITTIVTSQQLNLVGVRTHSDKRGHIARMRLTVEIPDLDSLSRLLTQISQLPNILDVTRVHR